MSARKKNRPASPELDMFKLPGDQESQLGQLAGEKSEESSEQFSPEDFAVLAQAAHAVASAANKIRAQRSASLIPTPPLTKEVADLFVAAVFDKVFRRMPAKECPFSGLNRGQLYKIFKLRSDGKPVIRHGSPTRKEGQKHGACHYNLGDALRYLERVAEQQDQDEPPKT
jgi:hypothetical protein